MKKRSMTIIFSSLIIAAFAVTMTGCAAREYRTDGSPVSTAPAEVVSTQPSVEENSEEPSEEESSEEPSEEESSEEESSEEESEEESSEEESEEEAEGIKITFVKPEKWDSEVNAYIYNDDKVENAVWPGEAMTDNGDGTYSYVLTKEIENPLVIFNSGARQYPRAKGEPVEDGKTYDGAVG